MAPACMRASGPASTLPPTEAIPLMREWFELLPTAIIFLNAGGRVSFANRAAVRLFGGRDQKLRGKTQRFCVRRGIFDEAYLAQVEAARDRTVNFLAHTSVREVTVQRRKVALRTTYQPVVVHGVYYGILATFVNITRERDAANLRDELQQMMFHDMQHPLSAIMLNLDGLLLLGKKPLTEQQRTFVETAKRNVGQLHTMFENMVEIGKLEQGEMTLHRRSIDMNALVHTVLEKQFALGFEAADKGLIFTASAHLRPVEADPNVIQRVVTNLLDNALKFTKEGGTVDVRTALGRDRRSVWVHVRDQGPGVPKRYAKAIFEKYRQMQLRRAGITAGAGLGLAFCKQAVAAHDGGIGVKPGPAGGSEFSFWLPCEPPASKRS